MYLAHKNHLILLKAINYIKKENNIIINLVFCGNNPKLFGNLNILKKYVKENNLDDQVNFLNFVTDEELPYLYFNSLALAMLSSIGPSNIPPWESFKMKIPVIYTRYETQNIFGDAVLNVDPTNTEELSNCLLKIFKDEELRKKLIKL